MRRPGTHPDPEPSGLRRRRASSRNTAAGRPRPRSARTPSGWSGCWRPTRDVNAGREIALYWRTTFAHLSRRVATWLPAFGLARPVRLGCQTAVRRPEAAVHRRRPGRLCLCEAVQECRIPRAIRKRADPGKRWIEDLRAGQSNLMGDKSVACPRLVPIDPAELQARGGR